jgi:hypothetical protein
MNPSPPNLAPWLVLLACLIHVLAAFLELRR